MNVLTGFYCIRTNNHLEGWHNRLNRKAGKSHNGFNELLHILIAEQGVMDILIQQVLSGNVAVGDLRRVNRVYAQKQRRVAQYTGEYTNGRRTLEQFLAALIKRGCSTGCQYCRYSKETNWEVWTNRVEMQRKDDRARDSLNVPCKRSQGTGRRPRRRSTSARVLETPTAAHAMEETPDLLELYSPLIFGRTNERLVNLYLKDRLNRLLAELDELCTSSADVFEVEEQVSLMEESFRAADALQTEVELDLDGEERQAAIDDWAL
ncbi:hypothetical protein T03_7998 [Trichinella britovi]|uniref:Uncharacterized protein n=1 Tax=Trichinella britovi TaxID=45882 RepID=A0A0V1CTV3_TRIBR|nr:hypothetical protein T03_7998 [Trichinella britovi]